MSTLQVQTLQGPTSGADSNTVRVADGHNLHAKGHVVQTVFTTSTTSTSSGATGWVANTLLDTSFTPLFSNSLIIVQVNLQVNIAAASGNSSAGGAVRIKSGTTVIGGNPSGALEMYYLRYPLAGFAPDIYQSYVKTVEDDSGDTGARTYTFETQLYTGSTVFRVSPVSPSTMKITEIAQ